MAVPISPIPISIPQISPTKIAFTTPPADGTFRNLLEQSIASVEAQRTTAQNSVEQFLAGEGDDLHKVALATQSAELSFEMFLQVRNKVVQAYQDIMRMQL